MPNIYQIIIDTNVLISGLRSRKGASYQMLNRLKDDRWQINISVSLILEYEILLIREDATLQIETSTINRILDLLTTGRRTPRMTELITQLPEALYQQVEALAVQENLYFRSSRCTCPINSVVKQ